MRITKENQITTFTYNNQDKMVSCTTMDKKLIRKLDKLCNENEDNTGMNCIAKIASVDDNTFGATYQFPASWIKVKALVKKNYTEEQKQAMAERAKRMVAVREAKKNSV